MRWPLVLSPALILSSACLSPTNPFDPDAPVDAQARAELAGKVQAVFALAPGEITSGVPNEGETLIEPAFCGPRQGDHGGFDVVLRELGASDDAPITARSETTSITGEFRFTNIPAGRYSLEILRPGFDVPPPRTLDFSAGELVNLPPLCALNRVAPEAPALASLPSVVDERNQAPRSADETPALVAILNCAEGVTYTIDQRPEGRVDFDATSTRVTLVGGEDACETPLNLSDPDGVAARTVWRVDVVGVDGLGNRSEVTSAFVVRDTLAPAAPTSIALTPGRDRLLATWAQPSRDDDDAPVGWLVSYGLVARPEDAAASCPFGAPQSLLGDDADSAAFAVEGASPLEVGVPSVTLSGLLPGTAVMLQVAAFDEAGNFSCWSTPVVARPDEVATSLESADETGVAATGGAYFFRGHAAFARGSAGLTHFAPDGTRTDLTSVSAFDVSGMGRRLYAAGGVAGVQRVLLPAGGGAPSAETLALGGDDVRSVLARPGLVVAGTTTGVRFVDPSDPASAAAAVDPGARGTPVVALAGEGKLLFLSRGTDGGSGIVQVVHRSAPTVVQGEVVGLGAAPAELLVVADALWFIDGERVRALDFSACFSAPGAGCLEELFETPMLAGASPRALTAWDDLVLVAAEGGDLPSASAVLALEPTEGGAPSVVGVSFGDDDDSYRHIEARDGGFCAHGSFGRACYRSVLGPLAEAPVRVTIGAPVVHAVTDADSLYLFSGGDVIAQSGFDGGERARWLLPQVEPGTGSGFPAGPARVMPSQAVDGVGVLTLDIYGRAFLGAPGDAGSELTRVDVDLASELSVAWPEATLADDSDVVTLPNGLIDLDGDRLIALVQNELRGSGNCSPTALIVLPLVEAADGTLGTGAPSVIELDDTGRLAQLLVDDGVAYASALPFGVSAVNLDDGAIDASGGVAAELACSVADVGAVKAYGVHPLADSTTSALVVGGEADVGGGFADRFFPLGSSVDLALAPVGVVQTVGAAGRFLAVGTALGGVYLYDVLPALGSGDALAPVLNLPTVSQVLGAQPTRRGVLLADGPGGAVLHRLR